MSAPVGMHEISEADAQGKTRAIFDEIQATLRVPFVNLVFRVLAGYPDFFQVAWAQLKPNLQTVYLEQCADDIRRLAAAEVAGTRGPAAPDDALAATVRTFHYVNPKLLVAVGALRSAVSGQEPRVVLLSRDEKRQIRPGVAPGAATLEMVDPNEAPDAIKSTFEDIRATLGVPYVNTDFRAYAHWPSYLEAAWATLKPFAVGAENARMQRRLRRRIEETVLALPYRMEVTPHTLRQSGLSERDIDGVRVTLDAFYALLPGLVLNTSVLAAGIDGADRAAQSPFPVEVL